MKGSHILHIECVKIECVQDEETSIWTPKKSKTPFVHDAYASPQHRELEEGIDLLPQTHERTGG